MDPESPIARFMAGIEQIDTGWLAVVTFEVGAAGPVATGFEVRSTQGKPVTRAVWDRVRVGHLIDEAAALVAWLGPVTKHPERAEPFETRPQRRGRGRGAPARYSDEHYRRVGQVYMAALAERMPPVRAVAKAFVGGFPGLTETRDRRARTWVREARARGYITEGGMHGEGE